MSVAPARPTRAAGAPVRGSSADDADDAGVVWVPPAEAGAVVDAGAVVAAGVVDAGVVDGACFFFFGVLGTVSGS